MLENKIIDVAFCADTQMEAPLHVAASSVLHYVAASTTVRFHLMLTGFTPARRDLLRKSLDLAGKPYELNFLSDPPDGMFKGLRPFHGNMTAYYRLALPDLVSADRLLYIDTDTVSRIDVSPLFGLSEDDYPVGFVEMGVVSDYPEKAFFASVGLSPNTPAFNSGVMLFNLTRWRAEGWTDEILAFGRQHPNDLVAADQTALIGRFSGDFQRLPSEFNHPLYPSNSVEDLKTKPAIYHFVGSPKPWDLGGRAIHTASSLYFEELARTAIKHRAGFFDIMHWRRMYKIRGGYFRTIRSRLRS